MHDFDGLMDFASRIARGAGQVTLRHFGSAAVDFKGDGSEVTAADLAAEEYLRASIAEAFPDDGIVGEEGQDRPGRSGRRWILDPIDGTRSFACGVPLYCVLVALEQDGVPVLGCCHFPAIGPTLVAGRGAGAWLDGAPARVSDCEDLGSARLITSGLEYWRDRSDDEGRAGLDRLVHATRFTRTWGDGYGYFLVATGRAELLADPIAGAYWDYAPMSVILPEAGGRFTRFDGQPVGAWSTALASNGRLHHAAARLLTERSPAGPPAAAS
ncbi:MAG TPA: inositol monophosphatase family protein [Longimicrobium sp.]|nr:inositol monophosphatase family protein [Longimicrobium sp.]